MKTKWLRKFGPHLVVGLFTLGLVTALAKLPSFAGPSAGVPVRVKLNVDNLDSTSWKVIIPSTVKGISGVNVFSSAVWPIQIGVAFAGEAADSEVAQIVVPPAMTLVGAPGAVFYPLPLGYGSRISIKALGTTGISSGEIDMSFSYN